MAYQYLDHVGNIYLLDTNFFGFPRFNAAYVIKGTEKNVLIDTGDANTIEDTKNELKKAGLTIQDIDYIFVTHCEHPDHSGNVGAFAKENPNIKVFINPAGEEYLVHPEIEAAERLRMCPPGMGDRFGKMTPLDPAQIHRLTDGEVIDIGDGDELTVTFTPGHQPSGIVIHEKKQNLLFINDLAGQYFDEFGVTLILSPDKSDVYDAKKHLEIISQNHYDWLALGHYGFNANPEKVMQLALSRMEHMLALAKELEEAGRLEELRTQMYKYIVEPEIDKIGRLREESFYTYYRDELGPNLCNGFARFYDRRLGKQVADHYVEAKK